MLPYQNFIPVWIRRIDQFLFPYPIPLFHCSFTFFGIFNAVEFFIVNKSIRFIFLSKTFYSKGFMLFYTILQIAGKADVQNGFFVVG